VNSQRKKITVLGLLLVLGGGWVGLASRYAGHHNTISDGGLPTTDSSGVAAPPSATIKEPSVRDIALGSLNPTWNDPDNLVSSANAGPGSRELFLKMMLSVGLVIGLGVAALYLSKRVLPRVVNAPGKEIHVLETTWLGPRKALHLVEVANQRLLIASTNENVTMLAHVSDGWLDMSRQEVDGTVKA
jgi:flagellar biogenesis protein FliO